MLYQKQNRVRDAYPVLLLVEHRGFEPLTPTLPVLCAPSCANAPNNIHIIHDARPFVKHFFEKSKKIFRFA